MSVNGECRTRRQKSLYGNEGDVDSVPWIESDAFTFLAMLTSAKTWLGLPDSRVGRIYTTDELSL